MKLTSLTEANLRYWELRDPAGRWLHCSHEELKWVNDALSLVGKDKQTKKNSKKKILVLLGSLPVSDSDVPARQPSMGFTRQPEPAPSPRGSPAARTQQVGLVPLPLQGGGGKRGK